jgi:para-aminobenzoate synthetase component 1
MFTISELIKQNIPFLLISNYEGDRIEAYPLSTLKENNIRVAFNKEPIKLNLNSKLDKFPPTPRQYKKKFDAIIEEIKKGNTYLINLTSPTPISSYHSLDNIFDASNAPYKIKYKDQFVCFSPESFITIKGDIISAYPMKGTIDASLPNAEETIMKDKKEIAEHTMVVDLLRNDLSKIATSVKVKRFRYTKKIKAGDKELIHVSSEIQGVLPPNWKDNFQDLIEQLLPAGSISGTPKKKTVEILKKIENYPRGFFTGIMGIYENHQFKSAIMIRFIEKTDHHLFYKSGGGITIDSNYEQEYKELIDKIYLPF